jgi:hypothetical protein
VKRLTAELLGYVMWYGVLIGPGACLLASGFFLWRQRPLFSNWRNLAGIVSLICSAAGVVTLWMAFFYQRKYGFEFNDPTVRLEFVHRGSLFASCGMLIGLMGKKRARSFGVVACVLLQLYWLVLVEQI